MCSKNKSEMKTQEAHEIKYNFDSLKDELTAFLYKLRLNLKLSNITYPYGPSTYENIVK